MGCMEEIMTKARDELRENLLKIYVYDQAGGYVPIEPEEVETILSQVDTYVKGIIGENDPINKNFEWTGSQERKKGKNILRAEQRKRAGLE